MHDRFQAEDSYSSIAARGVLKNFPGSEWPRGTKDKVFSEAELRLLEVGAEYFFSTYLISASLLC